MVEPASNEDKISELDHIRQTQADVLKVCGNTNASLYQFRKDFNRFNTGMEMFKAEVDAFQQESYQRFGKIDQQLNRQQTSINRLESDASELKGMFPASKKTTDSSKKTTKNSKKGTRIWQKFLPSSSKKFPDQRKQTAKGAASLP